MFDSPRLQHSIIQNITHRADSKFNTWNSHAQYEYNLEINVAHKTTHSDRQIMFDIGNGNMTINDYNLNVNVGNTNTYLGSTTMSYIDDENATSDALGTVHANFQQHIAERNMFFPSNIIETNKSDIEGSDSIEKENCDAYSNFHHIGYLFKNLLTFKY